jgi:hypothetical protein
MGSVAEQVTRQATCPVVTVRAAQENPKAPKKSRSAKAKETAEATKG